VFFILFLSLLAYSNEMGGRCRAAATNERSAPPTLATLPNKMEGRPQILFSFNLISPKLNNYEKSTKLDQKINHQLERKEKYEL